VRSLLARWRLSLRRTRADWPIVAAALLITLLATMLFAAGPIYSSAAALAGLRRTLNDAPATATAVQVSMYGTPSYVAGVTDQIHNALAGSLKPLDAEIVRDGRASATVALPQGIGKTSDRAMLGFLDDLPTHARLVQGAWPVAGAATDPVQAVVLDAVASDLNLSLGQQLTLTPPSVNQPTPVQVVLAGTFAVNDPAEPYWYGDAQLTSGIVVNGSDRTLGPFLTAPDAILGSTALTSLHVQWRAFPDFNGLTVDNVATIHGQLNGLAGRLPPPASGTVDVATQLPTILGNAERSLLVSRTEVLLLMAQLAIMAAYAIVLTANLLVDHRRIETALMRSRGAGPGHIALLALAEGLLLVVPAVLVAPWLAVVQASLLDVAGPLADIGLKIEPTVTSDSYLLAGAAGAICLALLVLPAFLAARSLTSEERDLGRQETRTFGARFGVDIALLAISGIALWQLRLYGAPLTKTVQGNLGFDPLLVAAPALGLLSGGILALRILPILASAMEHTVSRGRALVATLGSRQLARRPLRYTRTALLLMLAMSLGVFALSYSATWSTSQQDQAAYQAGADVRASVAHLTNGATVVPATYASLPGVNAAMGVERIAGGISLTKGTVDLLGVDADNATSIVRYRADESVQSLDELMGALREGRPAPTLVSMPDGAEYLRIDGLLDISDIVQLPANLGIDDNDQPTPIDPATLTNLTITATAIVRDAHGLIYKLVSPAAKVTGTAAQITLPLAPSTTPGAAINPDVTGRLDGPIQIAELDVVVGTPNNSLTSGARLGVSGWSAGPSPDGPWTSVSTDGWTTRLGAGRQTIRTVQSGDLEGMVVDINGDDGNLFLTGGPAAGRIVYTSPELDTLSPTIPVIANPAFLSTVRSAQGQAIDATIDGARRHLTIAGVVDSFPTTDPAKPLLIVDRPTLDLLRLEAQTTVRNVDEWWLSVAPGASADVTSALLQPPFNSSAVVSTDDLSRGLSTDPVALGIIGALLLGFVATGIFALVALVVSAAVSARQRRTEFALLRALGLSARQLSGWLWLENASLVLVSLLAGTFLGIVLSWVALPFITVTQQATTPVPGVLVLLPWDRILGLDVLVLIALGVAVSVLAVALRRLRVGSVLRLGED
jgi:hypothetical protein